MIEFTHSRYPKFKTTMKTNTETSFFVRSFMQLICFLLVMSPVAKAQEESFSSSAIRSSLREHYSSNRENRFLIKVQVWGDSPITGIFYLPDNATMMDLMGLTGGPSGSFDKTVISLTATQEASPVRKDKPSLLTIEGREMIDRPDYRSFPLQNGDIIHFNSPPKTDNFLRFLSVYGSILGTITASLSLFLILRSH